MIVSEYDGHSDKNLAEWLCRLFSDSADAALTDSVWQPTPDDWNALLDLARRHGVLPLLYAKLNAQRQPVEVPPMILNQMQRGYLQNAARNMRLYHDLSQVLARLHAANLPVIVLKGAYLAEIVYGNIALRPMCDIDLLVKTADIAHASECLVSLGYHSVRPYGLEGRQTFHDHLPPFMYPGKAPIEIHWQLALPDSPFMVNPDDIWRQAQPVSIAGCQAYGLAPEHLILYLCIHAAHRHNFTIGLQPLADLSVLCQTYQHSLNWEQLLRTAQQWKAERCLYLGLYFARQCFQATIPDVTLQTLQPDDVTPQWLNRLEARLWNSEEEISRHFLKMWKVTGCRERLRVALQRMFLSPEEMAGLYGVKPFSLAMYLRYPYRAWTLLKHHARTLWRLARRDPHLIAAGDQKLAFRAWLTTPNTQDRPSVRSA